MQPIPFSRPFLGGREAEYVAQAVSSGKIESDGPFTKLCAELLEKQYGIGRVLMTPSCTGALEVAAVLCGLEIGDEVILPSYTFVSTANAVVLRGARPVFVDIRPDTLNMDETKIEALITERTKAIFPVHYAGVGCEMDAILKIAARHKLLVVEDAAQGVHAAYRDRPLGSIGQLGTYSFHSTKNYVCGEAGALCVNAPELLERAEIVREKGTNRSKFFRGQVDKYTWVDIGGSQLANEIACAFLLAQLERLDPINDGRRKIFEFYRQSLEPLEREGLLRLPIIPPHCRQNYHMFYVLLPTMAARDALLDHLRQQGIGAVFHYVPLHTSPMGMRFGYEPGDLPVTEELSGRLLRLPLFNALTDEELAHIVKQVTAGCKAASARPKQTSRAEGR